MVWRTKSRGFDKKGELIYVRINNVEYVYTILKNLYSGITTEYT